MAGHPRILFIAEANSLAHVIRPLVLAKSLEPSRYEIHFACDTGYDFALSHERFARHRIHSISSEQFISALARGFRLYDFSTLSRYIEEDKELISTVAPDIVIGDFRLSLAVSAPSKRVPHAAIANAHWSPYANTTFPMPELPVMPYLGDGLGNLVFNAARPMVFRHHLRPLNKLRRMHGLSPLESLCHAYTHGDHTLYCDTPELVPTYALPDTHHYIGPLVWSPKSKVPSWWDDITEDRATIYLTLGSTGRVDRLTTLIATLAVLPVNLLVATAGRLSLSSLPRNVYVSDYLPGEEAAGRSDLVICNGGSGTVYQALAQGVPVLGVAANMDQHLTMGYVRKRGAGEVIQAGKASAKNISNIVNHIFENQNYRLAAQQIQREFTHCKASERFPRLLESWLH